MLVLKKALLAGLVLGSVALAGCAPQGKNAAAPAPEADVLSQLKSDPAASLQTAANAAGKAKSMAVTMDATIAGQKMRGNGVVQFGAPPMADMTMTVAGKEMVVRLIGTVEYIQVPAGQAAALKGKRWMKMDLVQVAKVTGMDGTQLAEQMENLDPAKQVKTMLAGKKLKAVGEDVIDGVKTVHYAGTMTLDQYVGAYAKSAQSRAKLKKSLASAKLDSISTDMWVDAKYQVRKGTVVAGPTTVTSTYRDYGKPVKVVPPPASETVDMVELLKGLRKVPA